MSKNILQQLFNGEIHPSESLCVDKPEYHRLTRKMADEKDCFRKTLSDSEIESFKRIEDLHHQLTELYSYEGFVSGYRLGVMLLFEALNEKENLSENGDE